MKNKKIKSAPVRKNNSFFLRLLMSRKSKKLSPLDPDKQTRSIDPSSNRTEPLVNNPAHHLFILAVKRAREERQQAKIRQKTSVTSTKKKKLMIKDIDRLFEEKCFRPTTMRMDLLDLYQKSPSRIRSMLDLHQIDQFIQTSENRRNNVV